VRSRTMDARKGSAAISSLPVRTIVVLIAVCATLQLFAQVSPSRIEGAVALSHVVKRVEPVWPQDAANAGALVAADVVITVAGAVESVTVIVGPESLRPRLIAALKQWSFKPFQERGRPAKVVTMIEFVIADPVKDLEEKHTRDFQAASKKCDNELGSRLPTAETSCSVAVRLGGGLPSHRVLEISHAHSMYGLSLLIADKPAPALEQLETALRVRRERGPVSADADVADLLVGISRAHVRIGNLQKAEEVLREAVTTFERAIVALPSMRDRYQPRLDSARREHAELRRKMGR
jgi:hypothetical protein